MMKNDPIVAIAVLQLYHDEATTLISAFALAADGYHCTSYTQEQMQCVCRIST